MLPYFQIKARSLQKSERGLHFETRPAPNKGYQSANSLLILTWKVTDAKIIAFSWECQSPLESFPLASRVLLYVYVRLGVEQARQDENEKHTNDWFCRKNTSVRFGKPGCKSLPHHKKWCDWVNNSVASLLVAVGISYVRIFFFFLLVLSHCFDGLDSCAGRVLGMEEGDNQKEK